MIWIILTVLTLATALFAAAPLYKKSGFNADIRPEIDAYLAEINRLKARMESGEDVSGNALARKTELERQLLTRAGGGFSDDSGAPKALLITLFAAGLIGAAGLYSELGRPDLTQAKAPIVAANPTPTSDVSLGRLTTELEQRLNDNPENQKGWTIYARSLMMLGRYDEAFSAYAKSIALSQNKADLTEELESARVYAREAMAAAPGPSKADIKAAQTMSASGRAAMITGMVEGLSAKLIDNPNDKDGWIRLLRARKILSQTDPAQNPLAQAEINRMKAAYADRPETVNTILKTSGWNQAVKR